MVRSLQTFALGVVALTAVAGCGGSGGGGSPTPSLDQMPTIKFVGNSSCPTSGATPYFVAANGAVKPANVNSLPPVGEAIDEMPHNHLQQGAQVVYNHTPPTSGCHYNLGYGQAPIQSGAYNQVVQQEYWVHNLEHGYIVVLYNCPSGCTTQFQQLRSWYHGLPNDPGGSVAYPKVIIVPYPQMDVPFAVESWDWYDPIPVFSVAEVQRFYDNHVGQGPEGGGA